MCELSVENLYYTCFHCAKQFKHVPTLLEHLRSHALKRFFCGLCDHKVNRPVQLPPTGTAAVYRYSCRLPVQLPPTGTAAAYRYLPPILISKKQCSGSGSDRIGIILADPDPYTLQPNEKLNCTFYIFPVNFNTLYCQTLWARIQIRIGSGSRRTKMTHKKKIKVTKFNFRIPWCSLLRTECFSCSWDVF